MSLNFKLDTQTVGKLCRTFLIAEVAQAHDGSLGQAYAFVDALSKTGVDAVKFQTHFAAEESTSRDTWRIKFSKQDKSRYDYWRRMEFTPEQWQELAAYTKQKGLTFLSSPFSFKAVELLDSIGMEAWKIGSGEIDNVLMFDRMIATGKPLIISTGMSNYAEITDLYNTLSAKNVKFALLHCTSEYPVAAEKIGLNVIDEFLSKFKCPVGFSSHFPNWVPSFAAIARGASIIEHHVVFSREMFGPDTSSSLTIDEMAEFVKAVRLYETIHSGFVNKDLVAEELKDLRAKFRKSIVAQRPLKKGAVLSLNDLAFKKPGDGWSTRRYPELIGKRLKHDKAFDDLITGDDVES